MDIFDYLTDGDPNRGEKIERFEYALKRLEEATGQEVKELLIARIKKKIAEMKASL